MSEMCWDLNPNCMAKGEGDAKRPCPNFEQKKSCWELDWKPLIQKISEEQKETMGKWLAENCPKCTVYNTHRNEIDQKIESILSKEIV